MLILDGLQTILVEVDPTITIKLVAAVLAASVVLPA